MIQTKFSALLLFAASVLLFWVSPGFAEKNDEHYQVIGWEDLLPFSVQDKMTALSKPDARTILETYSRQSQIASVNQTLQGQAVKIDGFVVPLEWDEKSALKEFLLVPYFGACIHVPPPPENQIIYVRLKTAMPDIRSMDVVSVYGNLNTEQNISDMGTAAYTMLADKVEHLDGPRMKRFIPAAFITFLCGLSICSGLLFHFFVRQWNALLFCGAVSISAGIMFSLGISTLSAQFSWPVLVLFASGTLVMAGFHALHRKHVRKKPSLSSRGDIRHYAAFAIMLHNIPECFAVFSAAMTKPAFGLVLAGAMIAHNIPLGFGITVPDDKKHSGYKRNHILLVGLIPPSAAIFFYLFMRSLLSPANMVLIFSFIGGFMVFIAVHDLLPAAYRAGGKMMAASGFISGILFMSVLLIYATL